MSPANTFDRGEDLLLVELQSLHRFLDENGLDKIYRKELFFAHGRDED